MSTAPSRMIYQIGETRERILVGAQTLFVEQGYAETQMKDTAVAVGISRHSQYRYYRDKNDLGIAIQGRIPTGFGQVQESVLAEFDGYNSGARLPEVQLLDTDIGFREGAYTCNRTIL